MAEDGDDSNELQQSSLSVFYDSDSVEPAEDFAGSSDGEARDAEPSDQLSFGQAQLPLYVLQLAADTPRATINWLVNCLQAPRRQGGAGLRISAQAPTSGQGVILHVSASRTRLLQTALRLQLRLSVSPAVPTNTNTPDTSGGDGSGGGGGGSGGGGKNNNNSTSRPLSSLIDTNDAKVDVDALLSSGQKQRLVRHEMDRLRATGAHQHVPGLANLALCPGQSIIRLLLEKRVIVQMFPTHEPEQLRRLGRSWYAALFQRQPFDEIRAYFGESVTMYFSFLGFYTTALLGPALLALIQLVFSVDTAHEYALYCLFNMLWVMIFLETWKRKCNTLAYLWGVLDKSQLSFLEPRASHWGEMRTDRITGRCQPYYPRWKTLLKLYAVSFPVVGVCLLLSFYLMLLSFWGEQYVALNRHRFGASAASLLILLPSVLYSAVVLVLNTCYSTLATALTEWENHRTQKQFDYYRVIKLALFEFVNSFMCLFYIAFYMQDMDMLRGQLAVMLIVQQLISHFQEALLPIVIRRAYSQFNIWLSKRAAPDEKCHRQSSSSGGATGSSGGGATGSSGGGATGSSGGGATGSGGDRLNVTVVPADDAVAREVQRQLALDPYPDTHDDYLELFVQFGYAFLFSSVFPMAAFWAVVNNVLEIRADAFKLCRLQQRPAAKVVRNIGAWMPAFEVLAFVCVCTNCALLCVSPQVRTSAAAADYLQLPSSSSPSADGSSSDWLLVFLVAEHVLLALRLLIHVTVPDTPGWVRRAVARKQFQQRQQLIEQEKRQLLRLRGSVRHGNAPAAHHNRQEGARAAEAEVDGGATLRRRV